MYPDEVGVFNLRTFLLKKQAYIVTQPHSLKRRPRSLGRRDRGFKSHLRHGCLSSYIHCHHSFVTLSSTLYILVTEKAS
jgi:hypothetical protein